MAGKKDAETFMLNEGYVYVPRRDLYFCREKRKCFSLEYVEDAQDMDRLAEEAAEKHEGPGIRFYTNTDMPPERKAEIEGELLGS